MYLCDHCPRAICSEHIPLPAGVNTANSTFVCPACHISIFSKPIQPYFVSVPTNIPFPFRLLKLNDQGFYRGTPSILNQHNSTWVPVLNKDQPLVLQGVYQMAARSQVLDTSLLIIHFILSDISPGGNPAQIVSAMMSAFLTHEELLYREIPFTFANTKDVGEHDKRMEGLMNEIQK